MVRIEMAPNGKTSIVSYTVDTLVMAATFTL
jgi:hypothetical protein